MKRKLFVLSLSVLTCLTLNSCDLFGLESKIDKKAANEIVKEAQKETEDRLVELVNGDYFGFAIDATASARMDVDVTNSTNLGYYKESSVGGEFEGSATARASFDMEKLKKDSLANSALYAKAELEGELREDNTTNDMQMSAEFGIQETEFEYALMSKLNGDTSNDSDTAEADAEIEEMFAEYIYEILTAVEDGDIDLGEGSYVDVEVDKELMEKTEAFENGELDADDYLDYIDEEMFDGELVSYVGEDVYDLIVNALERHEDILPTNFFEYSKVKEDGVVSLTSTFNYEEWKASFTSAVAEIALESVGSAQDIMDLIKEFTNSNLPDELSFSYTLKVDKKGVICGYGLAFETVGELEIESSYEQYNYETSLYETVIDTTKVEYDLSLNFDINFSLSNKEVEVPEI